MNPKKEENAKKDDRSDASVKSDNQRDNGVVEKPADDKWASATQGAGSNQYKFDNKDSTDKKKIDKKKEVDSQSHHEEKNVGAKQYVQKDKKNLNASPKEQRV